MARETGTVKWFSQEKGFGFVTREDGSDVFVHHTGISGRGFKTLEQGERVEFDIIEEPKGLKAQNLTRMDAPEGGEGMGQDAGYGDGYGNRAGGNYGGRSGGYGNEGGYGNRGGGGGGYNRPSNERGGRDSGGGWGDRGGNDRGYDGGW